MLTIGLLREGQIPPDNRVALTPAQCKWIQKNAPGIRVLVESSSDRCFSDREYRSAGIEVAEDISGSDVLFGIKEVPVDALIENKTYLFFSHTKKEQPYNQRMFRAILDKKITLIDYECLEHDDGQRILGFGFFAGIVGAHNGIMAYGRRTGQYQLGRVFQQQSLRELIHTYFGLRLPEIKVAVTGSGRVAHGVLEIMNLLEIVEVEPDEFLERSFSYPVFTQLKGAALYEHAQNKTFFEWEDLAQPGCRIQTIADITDDRDGSIPCNLGDASMSDPIYGVERISRARTAPYLPDSIDIMAVGNLPNELPRDASRYFGEQLIKHVLDPLVRGGSPIIERATMVRGGLLTGPYRYLEGYAYKYK